MGSCLLHDGETLSRPKVRPVERAILNRLRDMTRLDAFACGEVGDRSRNLQDAVVRSRGKAQSIDGVREQSSR